MTTKEKPQFEYFIFTEEIYGQIVNQMFRFASLYAFGQMLNRTPVFSHNDILMRDYEAKLRVQMPNFYKKIYFLKSRINLYSLLLFGMEKKYINSLKNVYNESLFDKIHFMVDLEMSRLEELHFAQKSCDSLLLTASLTANAFWMGYLMPEDKPIFFVRKKWQLNRYGKNFYLDSRENLPSDWITIEEEWLHKH
uniref:Uncharacterized protein n=2 Tax=Meloidogyne incognita group TaxID=654580 RepID=A0A915LND7_MELJA